MKIFKTNKGTELPILDLRGKDYLEVKYRIVWFREEHPLWSIETEFVSLDAQAACARAIIKDETGRIITTSHKAEDKKGFPDFMEKAETGAIGRALALIGYGTQFCADELDEGDRIVDAPAIPTKKKYTPSANSPIKPKNIKGFIPSKPEPSTEGGWPSTTTVGIKGITDEELKNLWDRVIALGYNEYLAKEFLRTHSGKDSSKEWDRFDYDNMCRIVSERELNDANEDYDK